MDEMSNGPPLTFKEKLAERIEFWRMALRVSATIYTTVALPVRIGFLNGQFDVSGEYLTYVVLDALATLFFALEIIASYRRLRPQIVPVDDEGGMGSDAKSTRSSTRSVVESGVGSASGEDGAEDDGGAMNEVQEKSICSMEFVFDVLSTLPLEYIAVAIGEKEYLSYFLLNRV